MGCLTCEEMRFLEKRVFKMGVTPEALMDRAGRGIADAIRRRYAVPGEAIACIGRGNNGGDALVALKYLAQAGWVISVHCAVESNHLYALPRKKWRELDVINNDRSSLPLGPRIVLDGLLGIGASGPLRGSIAEAAEWINTQRGCPNTCVIAMDIPTGINGNSGVPCKGAVIADLTLTVGICKRGLLMPAAVNHTGSIETVLIDELQIPKDGELCLNDVHSLRGLLPHRPHDLHKGNAGRVGLLAGSRGMLGAAVLCSSAALRAGAGLVTLFCEKNIYPSIAPMLPPEVMLQPVNSLTEIEVDQFDVFALGPGMGIRTWKDGEYLSLLKRITGPVIVDADGLSIIASSGVDCYLRSGMVITPHPGEMQRLFPDLTDTSRLESVSHFAEQFPDVCLLLKGAHSLITHRSSLVYVNGTGHPGMAGGGQGDVLTGALAALMGQGLKSLEASRMAAWLCGRSAELAIARDLESPESILPSDVIRYFGIAFRELRR